MMKQFGLLILMVLSLCWSTGAATADSGPEAWLDHAADLRRQGDLYRAEGELKRFLYLAPGHGRTMEAEAMLRDIRHELYGDQPVESPRSAPWTLSRPRPGNTGAQTEISGPAEFMIRLYQDHLRTFKRPGGSCPSYPNCSEYAVQAVRKHGGLLGSFVYVDRFWREVTTVGTPPFVYVDGRRLHFDPLEANDYWLEKGVNKQ